MHKRTIGGGGGGGGQGGFGRKRSFRAISTETVWKFVYRIFV